MMDLRWTFLVVRSGKPPARSKRICQPNVDSVPVPVRSDFLAPRSSTWRMRSRYCFIGGRMLRGRGEMIACYSAAVDARQGRGGIARQVQITAKANAQ